MTEKITVEKLHGSDNYASWSNDLSIILNHYERWSGGTSSKATNPEYSAWKKGANKAMFCIVMTAQRFHPIRPPFLYLEYLAQ